MYWLTFVFSVIKNLLSLSLILTTPHSIKNTGSWRTLIHPNNLWPFDKTSWTNCVIYFDVHDDEMKWNHFPGHWPFVRDVTGHRWIPSQRPAARSFDVFFDLRLNKSCSLADDTMQHIAIIKGIYRTANLIQWLSSHSSQSTDWYSVFFGWWIETPSRSLWRHFNVLWYC